MPRKPKRKSTQAQIDAVKRYQSRHAEIKVRCDKAMKIKYADAAKERGLSLNEFTLRALDMAMSQKEIPEQPKEDVRQLLDDEIRRLKKSRRY